MIVGMIKLLFIFLMVSNSHGDHLPPRDYSLLFPSEPHYASAIIENPGFPGNTTELTISMWVYQVSSGPKYNTFLSYNVYPYYDAFSFYSYGDTLYLEMGYLNEAPVANIVTINEWVHYLVSWQSEDGLVQFYVNGELAHSEIHHNVAHTWGESNGVLVLGQEQDNVGGGFDPDQTFRGELTEINIWNKILTREEVQQVYHSRYEGNIIAWSRAVWTLDGKIAVVKSSDKHAH